jgi:hypothetical protein
LFPYHVNGIGNCSPSWRAGGGPSIGLFSQAHKSLKMNSCCRNSAARLESEVVVQFEKEKRWSPIV